MRASSCIGASEDPRKKLPDPLTSTKPALRVSPSALVSHSREPSMVRDRNSTLKSNNQVSPAGITQSPVGVAQDIGSFTAKMSLHRRTPSEIESLRPTAPGRESCFGGRGSGTKWTPSPLPWCSWSAVAPTSAAHPPPLSQTRNRAPRTGAEGIWLMMQVKCLPSLSVVCAMHRRVSPTKSCAPSCATLIVSLLGPPSWCTDM
mmetsp:Transcript_2262/g.6414  ORF Transcript_2262/g.6414 Transcript_2262/m.6414 type:complete len:203 (-) Transcript_2262:1990-2598(-)